MDKIDIRIIDLLKGNARMSYQELGDQIGMSRVAAKKRVQKLEERGIIRGYNTCIYRDDEVTMLIDIVTIPERYEDVLKYVSTQTIYVRQIFRTSKENHIHMVAVSDSVQSLSYLTRMIRKQCGDDIVDFHCHTVTEVVKDVYGGIRYEDRTVSISEAGNE